jgi:AcrR family transcriptional regulator
MAPRGAASDNLSTAVATDRNSRSQSAVVEEAPMSRGSSETPARLDDRKILGIAGEAFARNGFDGVGMRDLAEKCATTTSLLYYRFGSKESLYEEACQYELDCFFDVVEERLGAVSRPQRKPDLLAEAIFDAWLSNPYPLLLANQDVVNAKVFPDRWLSETHYSRMVTLIRKLCSAYFGVEVDEDTCFAFAATAFGFGSMLIIDQRFQMARNPAYDAAAAEENFRRKRAALVRTCKALLTFA